MSWHRIGLRAKILLPTMIIMLASFALLLGLVLYVTRGNAVDQAVASATETIQQFKTLRGYYTKAVVSKVKANGNMGISFNHAAEPDAIPLPATMIHELSEVLGEREGGVKLRLYSAYPFPNRKGRQVDAFGQAAMAFLAERPEEPFVSTVAVGGSTVVRVGIADRMVAQACVDCHNTRPDTTRTSRPPIG